MTHATAAVLFHVVGWESRAPDFEVAEGLWLRRLKGSPVERLYHRLCEEGGLDDGEPFEYGSYAEFTPTETRPHFLDAGDPYSDPDRFCDVVAIVLGTSLSMTRVIWSRDGFASAEGTQLMYVSGAQSDALQSNFPPLNDDSLATIRSIWGNAELLWHEAKSAGRISSALTYFGYAWRARYLDQACLNLAIVLEILFAPHIQSETTHQIAYGIAHFNGGTREKREQTYEFAKRFYRLRSSIVHGGTADDNQLWDSVPTAFALVSQLLRRILVSKELSRIFNNQRDRANLLRDMMFWTDPPSPTEVA